MGLPQASFVLLVGSLTNFPIKTKLAGTIGSISFKKLFDLSNHQSNLFSQLFIHKLNLVMTPMVCKKSKKRQHYR